MPLIDTPPDALAEVYAQSLFDLAQEQGGRDAIESALGELEEVLELARQDARFSEFLASRVLARSDRGASLERIFKGRLSDLVLRFLLVLNAKDRLAHLPAIVSAYDATVQKHFGRVEVDLYTASPVSPAELTAIKSRLAKVLGREPIVHPYTDGSLLGGLKLQIGDRLIDNSLATRLRKLKEQMGETGFAAMRAAAGAMIEGAEEIVPARAAASAPAAAAAKPAAAREERVAPLEATWVRGSRRTSKRTVADVDVAGKRVLIRVDFNVPIEDGRITDDRRIRAATATIRSVVERGGRAVLMSHLGRPSGKGPEPSMSLAPVADRLARLLGRPVGFPSTDCVDRAAADAVAAMRDGDIVLLENLRFHKAEREGDAAFAKRLASLGDVYVNDAFGTCHRPDTSMVALPRAMDGRPRVIGFLVEAELAYLADALREPQRPFVVVLGGAKVSDKIGAIEALLPRADAVIVGGAMAYTFLAATGKRVGESRVESDRIADAKRAIELAAKLDADLHLPSDHVCSTVFAETGGDVRVVGEHIPDGSMGLDIGPRTQAAYSEILRGARTIVWNGPMGVFEWRPFRVGTEQVANAIAEATGKGATTIVGGGDTAAAVERFGLADRMSHVSTGGGASVELLEGRRFESIELLDPT